MPDIFRKEYKPLTDDQKQGVENVKDKAEELMSIFSNLGAADATDKRYLALAKTELENSVMWAVKAIT